MYVSKIWKNDFLIPTLIKKIGKKAVWTYIQVAGSGAVVNKHVTWRNNTHQIDWENVKVLEKEPRNFPRKVLEDIHIRKKGPNLWTETKDGILIQSGTTWSAPLRLGGEELNVSQVWRHSKVWRYTGCLHHWPILRHQSPQDRRTRFVPQKNRFR